MQTFPASTMSSGQAGDDGFGGSSDHAEGLTGGDAWTAHARGTSKNAAATGDRWARRRDRIGRRWLPRAGRAAQGRGEHRELQDRGHVDGELVAVLDEVL